jgi:O-antigen/teichoic acid export membrane protein
VLSSINIYITIYLDRIAIKHFMTLNDVGIYGVGYRFASIVSLFMTGITMSLTPIIYNKYKLSTTPAEIAKIFRYFISVALSAIILLSAVSYELMVMLTTPLYLSAWIVIPVIAGAILFSNMYIFMPGMDIAKKTKYITLINVATGIMNVTLNILFVPFMGIMGAAVATLCSSVVMFTLYAYFSQKFYYVPHQWGRFTTAAIFCAVTVLLNIYIVSTLLMPTYLMISVKTILSVAAVTAILIILIGTLEMRYMKSRIFSSFASKIGGK